VAFQRNERHSRIHVCRVVKSLGIENDRSLYSASPNGWKVTVAWKADRVRSIALPNAAIRMFPPSLDQEIHDRARELTSYQNAAYATQYLDLVARARATEQRLAKGTRLTSAVSRYYFKLMAYKDEYEMAPLYTVGRFKENLCPVQWRGFAALQVDSAFVRRQMTREK